MSSDEFRRVARRRLPRIVFDIIEGGAEDELTVAWNRDALQNIRLLPNAFGTGQDPKLDTTVLGRRVSMPILLAPCAFARMCNSGAEGAVAAAAAAAGTMYAVPSSAASEVAERVDVTRSSLWQQLYLVRDEQKNDLRIAQAAEAGHEVLCVSVDSATKPRRERDLRNRVSVPFRITPNLLMAGASRPSWALDFMFGHNGGGSGSRVLAARRAYSSFEATVSELRGVTLTDVDRIRRRWKGKLVVKGVMQPDEVATLAERGVDGVVVSNHGGRNLDTTAATIDHLGAAVSAAGGVMEVYVDGGVRRGTDVVKALALGARAVLIGRPYMYALAAGGEDGVFRLLSHLADELRVAMSFLGAATVEDLGPSMLQNG